MTYSPVVSIVIPVYNRPELLKRALISIEKQTYSDWECIIVNDGSTDNTRDIILDFAKKDYRIRLIQNEHSGGNKATNDGIFAAFGKYITLLGSDDEFAPSHIELRVNELQQSPDIDMLHGGFTVIGDEMIPDKRDITKMISLYSPLVYVGGTIFGKREVFHKLHGFTKMAYASDSDFVERAIARFSVKRVSWQTYIYYRNHGSSATDRVIKGNTRA